MRASWQTSTRDGASGCAQCLRRQRAQVRNRHQRQPAANPRPCATAAASRTPVKAAGPRPNAIASSVAQAQTPASSSSACDHAENQLAGGARARVLARERSAPSSHSAAEHSSVAVSSASSFTPALPADCAASSVGGAGKLLQQAHDRRQFGHPPHAAAGSTERRVRSCGVCRRGSHDHHHATILLAADQPADALLQRQHRLGQLVAAECTRTLGLEMLDARAHYRILGRSERQLVDDHQAQRRLPARPRPPRSSRCRAAPRAAGAESSQQLLAWRRALHQQRPARRLAARAAPRPRAAPDGS